MDGIHRHAVDPLAAGDDAVVRERPRLGIESEEVSALIPPGGIVEDLIGGGGGADHNPVRADRQVAHLGLAGELLGDIEHLLRFLAVGAEEMACLGAPGGRGAAVDPAVGHEDHVGHRALAAVDRALRAVGDEVLAEDRTGVQAAPAALGTGTRRADQQTKSDCQRERSIFFVNSIPPDSRADRSGRAWAGGYPVRLCPSARG